MATATEDGVRVHRVWMLPAMGTGSRRVVSYVSFTASCALGLVRTRKPDVILIESPPLFVAVPGIVYGALRRVPVVLNVADLWPDAAVAVGAITPGRRLRWMFALERWAYRRADLVSTVTDGVKARLIDKSVPADKIAMLVNGVDTSMFCPDAADPAILDELALPSGPFLIYAGTMGLAHDLDPLLTAMASLTDESDMPYLLMIGGGSERDRLEQRVRDERITNVVFRKAIPPAELARLLPLAQIGVVTLADIPLNRDTRPAKLLPLMASGIPCLFAGTGEGTSVLTEHRAGLAVRNNPPEIAEALRSMAHDPAGRQEMGSAGRESAVDSWSWRAHVAPWREAVERLVNR
ncbi:MAG: glycosyl transferase group 1 [Acidimicrobiales bacterium]|nr:glycosyl transferase group 1 [Acidimicrobiales bacterium]